MRISFALGVVATTLALAGPASAETFTVDSTKDRLDADLDDALCADANGKCTLRAAIAEANDTPGDDMINLPAGTFELTREPTKAVTNDEGDLDLTEAVVLNGSGRRNTVIKQTVRDRVLRNVAPPGEVFDGAVVTDLTVTGGDLRGGEFGGGIYNDGGLVLDLVSVRDNRAAAPDGQGVNGAGVYLGDNDIGTVWQVSINNSVIRGNSTAVKGGGTASGGGLYVDIGTESLSLTGSRVIRNEADPGGPSQGGGIAIGTSGVSITDTTLAANRADFGGGIHVNTGSAVQDLALDSSTLSANDAEDGSALYVNGGLVDVDNSTFSGNTEQLPEITDYGSAVHNAGTMSIEHATIAKNPARPAIFADGAGSVVVDSSVVAGKGAGCKGSASAVSSDLWNVFDDPSCADGPTDHVGNPMLADLADNGGRTLTMALRAGSPAIDHVSALVCPPPKSDQRGITRPEGAACDAGAYERELP